MLRKVAKIQSFPLFMLQRSIPLSNLPGLCCCNVPSLQSGVKDYQRDAVLELCCLRSLLQSMQLRCGSMAR